MATLRGAWAMRALRVGARAASSSASVPSITRVGVLGLGLMGSGIAQTAAAAGFEVVCVDTPAGAERGLGMIRASLAAAAARAAKKEGAAAGAAAEAAARLLGLRRNATKALLGGGRNGTAEVEVPAAGSSRLTVVIQTGLSGPSSNRERRIIVTPSGRTSMVVVTGISNS